MKGNVVIQQSFRPLTPPYKMYFKKGSKGKGGFIREPWFPYWEGPYPTSKGMRP